MSEILSLFEYHRVNPTTWVYLSSLLTIGLFFKFNRFWSVRNLDLVIVMLLGPGLLMANYGLQKKAAAEAEIAAELQQQDARSGADAELPFVAPVEPTGSESGAESGAEYDASSIPESSGTPPDELPVDKSPENPNAPITSDDAGTAPQLNPTGAERAASATPEPSPPEPSPAESSSVAPSPAEVELRRAERIERLGYIWLFAISAALLLRLLADPTMVRRPLLDPNLTVGGLAFSCCALFMFLMANVVTSAAIANENPSRFGPGYRLLYAIPEVPVTRLLDEEPPSARAQDEVAFGVTAKVIAVLGHLAIVLGIVMIGYRHFDNIRTGIGTATLYLLLPYTAQMTGRVDHVLPAALLVWAIYFYRRPMTAGVFVGLASVVYYPLFLLPLWISFYWQRGKMRFLTGFTVAMLGLVLALMIFYGVGDLFRKAFVDMFGLHLPVVRGQEVTKVLAGFWNYYHSVYRLPLLAFFIVLSLSFALWPAQKNLGTLMCCTAAVMVAAQFWHRFNGGTYMAWYLPLLLLTVFRPNLEDRVAVAVLGEGWFPRRRAAAGPVDRAA